MSAYEDDADRLAEHVPELCDDPYCQICIDEAAGDPLEPPESGMGGAND